MGGGLLRGDPRLASSLSSSQSCSLSSLYLVSLLSSLSKAPEDLLSSFSLLATSLRGDLPSFAIGIPVLPPLGVSSSVTLMPPAALPSLSDPGELELPLLLVLVGSLSRTAKNHLHSQPALSDPD